MFDVEFLVDPDLFFGSIFFLDPYPFKNTDTLEAWPLPSTRVVQTFTHCCWLKPSITTTYENRYGSEYVNGSESHIMWESYNNQNWAHLKLDKHRLKSVVLWVQIKGHPFWSCLRILAIYLWVITGDNSMGWYSIRYTFNAVILLFFLQVVIEIPMSPGDFHNNFRAKIMMFTSISHLIVAIPAVVYKHEVSVPIISWIHRDSTNRAVLESVDHVNAIHGDPQADDLAGTSEL